MTLLQGNPAALVIFGSQLADKTHQILCLLYTSDETGSLLNKHRVDVLIAISVTNDAKVTC